MTTKRKLILKAIALSGAPTVDDLVLSTGLQRKNLQDNLKACMAPVPLLERIRDDVTGLPAYKLTKQGREWLENDKDDSSTKQHKAAQSSTKQPQAQAQVGDNSASKDKGSHVVGGGMTTDPLPLGNAVTAPPDQPQKAPVDLVSADVMDLMQRNADLDVRLNSAGKSIVEFCEWLAIRAKVRVPMNLHESKQVIESLVKSQPSAKAEVRALEDRINVQSCNIKDTQDELETAERANIKWLELAKKHGCNNLENFAAFVESTVNTANTTKSENIALTTLNASMPGFGATFAALKQSDLPAGVTLKNPQPNSNPIRYIVADSYTIADCPESANAYALERVNHNGTESSVVVFEANRARELRINWSDV